MLSKAACIQANTVKEADDIRAYGLNNPIAVIPNGVTSQASPISVPNPRSNHAFALKDRAGCCFSRASIPKKDCQHLLKAWAKILKIQKSGKLKFGVLGFL